MRIGLITNMMDQDNAGIGRYVENLVKNLLKIDKKNDYFLIHTNKNKYSFNGNYKEIRFPFFNSIPKKMVIGTFLFEKICKDNKLDIIHDLGQISPFFLKSKTKKILTIFDLTPNLYPQFFTGLTIAYTKLFPLILKNTDCVITISNNSKKDIKKIFNLPEEKIKVTYLGIDKKFKQIRDKTKLDIIRRKYSFPEKFILFVGTIEPRKNLTLLIRAFSEIKINGVKLVIVGVKGWKYQEIFKTIDKLKVKNDIIFTDFVDDEDLSSIYNLAELFVYPSFYEGFGFPVLEAMRCGCPVVTSNISSFPEITEGAAILIDPKKKNELANAIKNVIMDSKLKKKLKINSLKQAKRFRWEDCAKQTLEVYTKLR